MALNLSSDFFQSLQLQILEDFEEARRYFKLPLVLYRQDNFVLLRNPDEFANWIRSYRASLRLRGVEFVKSQIIAQSRASQKMSSYLVEQRFLDPEGKLILSESMKYYIRESGDAPAIEMIEQL